MKKFLAVTPAVALLLPVFAFAAAYNDVSLDSNVVLNVNGITVDVSGSGATIASITVNAANFTVDMQSGSSITVTAPNRNQLNASAQDSSGQTITCDDSTSKVTISSNTTQTVTFTPSSTLCAAASSSSSGGNGAPASGGGGGGGGGGGAVVAPAAVGTQASTPSASSSSGNASLIAQLQAQVQALLAQIAALRSGGTAGAISSFARNLASGSVGADVKALQIYLNAHGYAVASRGPGSPGNETTRFGALTRAALAKFQKAAGISPASGYFGPKTRAYISAHQ